MTTQTNKKYFKTGFILSALLGAVSILAPEIVFAAKFDIDAGVKAAYSSDH